MKVLGNNQLGNICVPTELRKKYNVDECQKFLTKWAIQPKCFSLHPRSTKTKNQLHGSIHKWCPQIWGLMGTGKAVKLRRNVSSKCLQHKNLWELIFGSILFGLKCMGWSTNNKKAENFVTIFYFCIILNNCEEEYLCILNYIHQQNLIFNFKYNSWIIK